MLLRGVLAALSLAGLGASQGYFGTDQSSCSQTQAFTYQGCFAPATGTAADWAGYTFRLNSNSAGATGYPNYTSYANTTVDVCLTVCRAYGYRFAALAFLDVNTPYCKCGSIAPTTSQTLDSNPNNNSTTNACHGTLTCPANPGQFCGSRTASDIYMDTSFSNSSSDSAISNYGYLGCFASDYTNTDTRFPLVTKSTFFNQYTTPTFNPDCLARCASLGYPYAASSQPDGSANNCQCGSSIVRLQSNNPNSQCNVPCNSGT